jgi:hypothetical protein
LQIGGDVFSKCLLPNGFFEACTCSVECNASKRAAWHQLLHGKMRYLKAKRPHCMQGSAWTLRYLRIPNANQIGNIVGHALIVFGGQAANAYRSQHHAVRIFEQGATG